MIWPMKGLSENVRPCRIRSGSHAGARWIDVVVDRVGAAFAARRRHHDVAALALDLDAFAAVAPELQPSGSSTSHENQMRAAGCAAVLAGDDRLRARSDHAPLRYAVGVILRRVDVEHPHAGRSARRQADQIFVSSPPGPDLDRIGGRFLEDPVPGIGLPLASLSRGGTGFLSTVTGNTGKPCAA